MPMFLFFLFFSAMGYGIICIALTFVAAELGGVLQVQQTITIWVYLVVEIYRFKP